VRNSSMVMLRDEYHLRAYGCIFVITVVLAVGDDLLGFCSTEGGSSH
jgi:hypothetical protein